MNMKITSLKKVCVSWLALSALLLSGSALAIPVTLAGTHVNFTFDDALLGLYGTPMVFGNSLVFTPPEFKAISADGQGIKTVSSTINIQVRANANYNLTSFSLTELGDYSLIGSGAKVLVGGQIRAFDLANPASFITNPIKATAPLGATTTFDENFETTNWEAKAAITQPTNWSNGVNLTLENILKARTTLSDSEAFIEKKYAGVFVTVTAVPEAQTYAMMLVGLGLVGFMARRTRASV